MDLTEAENIKERWKEHTEELSKKDLHDADNKDGVITHLEPDILESEVKEALGSITTKKASRGDGILDLQQRRQGHGTVSNQQLARPPVHTEVSQLVAIFALNMNDRN